MELDLRICGLCELAQPTDAVGGKMTVEEITKQTDALIACGEIDLSAEQKKKLEEIRRTRGGLMFAPCGPEGSAYTAFEIDRCVHPHIFKRKLT